MNDLYGVLILSFNSSISPLTLIYILDRYSEIHKASQSFLSPPPPPPLPPLFFLLLGEINVRKNVYGEWVISLCLEGNNKNLEKVFAWVLEVALPVVRRANDLPGGRVDLEGLRGRRKLCIDLISIKVIVLS